MAHVLAGGYHGPPPLTVARGFTQWTLDPWMLALVLLLGAAYLTGVVRGRDHGPGAAAPPWPWTRVANFGLGLAIVVIATMGSFGAYSGVLFFMRAFQTILLLMLAPLFLTLGRPLTLFIEVFPRAGQRLERAVRSKAARVLTFPAITTLALIAVPFVMYFTGWYVAVFHSVTVREVTFLALMLPGYVFFWTLLRVDPVPKIYSYGVSLWITAFEVVGDAFLGLAVIADTGLIGSAYYHALARPWGLSPRTDQIVGGGTLWIFGDLVGLPFLVAQLIQFIREDEAEAAEIDAELDAREAARDAARAARKAAAIAAEGRRPARDAAPADPPPSTPPGPENAGVTSDPALPETSGATAANNDSEADDPERPWWESDPRFQERFRQV
ncbi:MAG TPA: cytochrome c oxidase assembly protein [Streptosporangiaceae bacterium]|nr:cytochrome c oxidase assembly protein [Streptosporangiaceae bacterium]